MNIVLYKTQTGHTKEYAEMIAAELNCEALPIKTVSKKQIKQYDTIIYGAPVHMAKMMGVGKVKRWAKDKQLILFGCGADPGKEENIKKYRNKVVRDTDTNISFFYTPGGFNFDNLTGFTKKMMGFVRNMMSKSKELSEDDQEFLDSFENPTHLVDAKHIQSIVDTVLGR